MHVDVVHIGAYCTAQGAIQQLGETVVALNTIVGIFLYVLTSFISHTFSGHINPYICGCLVPERCSPQPGGSIHRHWAGLAICNSLGGHRQCYK